MHGQSADKQIVQPAAFSHLMPRCCIYDILQDCLSLPSFHLGTMFAFHWYTTYACRFIFCDTFRFSWNPNKCILYFHSWYLDRCVFRPVGFTDIRSKVTVVFVLLKLAKYYTHIALKVVFPLFEPITYQLRALSKVPRRSLGFKITQSMVRFVH